MIKLALNPACDTANAEKLPLNKSLFVEFTVKVSDKVVFLSQLIIHGLTQFTSPFAINTPVTVALPDVSPTNLVTPLTI